ncbi:MAG: MerR family transcriptional regulator [Candidatus Nanopelagicales bacterium]
MDTFDLAEVADAASVPTRTVRYYQATGLLPSPARVGRRAVYTTSHLERLQEIADLRARGLKLDGIREVLNASDNGNTPIVALLGPEFASEQWLTDASATFTGVELAEFLGERNLVLVAELERHHYLQKVETEDGVRWRTDDLPLLRGALQLAEVGTEVELSARSRDLLRRRTRRLAEDLVQLWAEEAGQLFAGSVTAGEIALYRDRVRAVAWQSAAHVMAQEIDRALERAALTANG